MDSRKPVRNLSETLHSLLGLKAHLTSNWVKTVCEIVRTLPSERSAVSKPSKTETKGPFDTIDDDSGGTISRIKHEIAVLTEHINELNAQRRQVLNELLDLKGNIRVFCRIRPLTLGENLGRLIPVVALDSSNVVLKLADNKRKSYSFDKVLHPGSSQDEVFSEVEPVIKSVIDGYNACIFAYGQTGTGKTYTMEGSPDAPGAVPRAIEALFKQAGDSNHAFLVSFSMLEIYMGNLKDLLVPRSTKPTDPMPPCLSVQSDPQGGIEIENLVAIQVNDFNQALRLYRLGCRFRSTASTNSNLTSSRSHCLIRIAITCFHAPERRRETNKIWFIDLGGSERVLKTKASGRRLDEGKAINLSLSALGDVIYALQRKKSHIPYRNSKLTQVLKDSLGDDSKTLMLVHVSPKEEDLCETICSLNFATRVASIHLGNDETIEMRQQKELALASLQQQMRKIEDERLHVRKVIQKLNKKLEDLTGIILSSDEQIETYHLSTEGPLPKNSVGDISEDPSSKLPRFMRPTVCSQRKSGTGYQTSEEKYPARRRRRAASHRAESVNFPVKDHSRYNSDCSISRSSCLAGLNTKNSTDNATEYSQDTSAADLNMIDIQEPGRKAIASISQKDENGHGQENSNGWANRVNQKRFSKVDNWFHLQKKEPAINGKSSKRGLAIPMPQKKNTNSAQSLSEKFDAEKVHKFEFTMQKVVNNEQSAIVTGGGVGRVKPEVVTDKPLTTLKDLFKKNSRSDLVSPPQTPEGKRMTQRQNSAGTSSIEDNECGTFSPPDSCCNDQYKGVDNEASTMSIMQAVEAEGQRSDSWLQKDLGCCECNSSISDVSISYSKGNSSVSIFSFELEPCCHAVPTESDAEDGSHDFESFDTSFRTSKREKKIDLLHLRSQRALFMKSPQQNNSTISFNIPQVKAETGGICSILKQKIEILSASALLGLGFYNLGFEHDFFNGLML